MGQHAKPPSLKELCTKKALNLVLKSDYPAADFAALEPRLIEFLFNEMQTENARLKKMEKKWQDFEKQCPWIDRQMYLLPGWDFFDDDDLWKHIMQFRSKWEYIEINDTDTKFEGTDSVAWSGDDLVAQLPEVNLELCSDPHGGPNPPLRDSCFGKHISSQLLLYRLIVIFGLPPQIKEDYDICWAIWLRRSGESGFLHLGEVDGVPFVEFVGTSDASIDAMELTRCLIGTNCMHRHGIVAGTIA